MSQDEQPHLTKAIPPRPKEPRGDEWRQIDALFYRTIGHAENAFKVNMAINLVIVAVGIALITYSIAYSWTKGLDIYGTAFGTLGVVSFIATFFISPQKNITKSMADLTQLQLCYRTYSTQWEAINNHLAYHEEQMTLEELEKVNRQLQDLTFKTVEEIENYVSKPETTQTAQQPKK